MVAEARGVVTEAAERGAAGKEAVEREGGAMGGGVREAEATAAAMEGEVTEAEATVGEVTAEVAMVAAVMEAAAMGAAVEVAVAAVARRCRPTPSGGVEAATTSAGCSAKRCRRRAHPNRPPSTRAAAPVAAHGTQAQMRT